MDHSHYLLLFLIPIIGVTLFISDKPSIHEQCLAEEGDCIGTYLITEDETVLRVQQTEDLEHFVTSVDYMREHRQHYVIAAFPDDTEGQRDLRLRWCEQTPTPPTCG